MKRVLSTVLSTQFDNYILLCLNTSLALSDVIRLLRNGL